MAYNPPVGSKNESLLIVYYSMLKENDKKSRSLAWEALRNADPVDHGREKECWPEGHESWLLVLPHQPMLGHHSQGVLPLCVSTSPPMTGGDFDGLCNVRA